MPQDAFTLKFLCEELSGLFKGGKVNRIIQPSNDEIVMTVYTGKRTEKLLIDVNPASPRIGVTLEEKDSPLTAPNFCMLMRKHLLSSTVLGVELVGFDRIVKIDFLSSGEFFDAVKKTLYVELMGRYSNVILTEDGKVLGGNRGINMFDNGVRPLIVNKPYVFPPVGNKKTPSDLDLLTTFSNCDKSDLVNVICANVQGLATSTAKEIVFTFIEKFGSLETNNFPQEFFDHLNSYIYQTKSNPCVIFSSGEVTDVCVYPYDVLGGEFEYFEKLYLAEEYYFTERQKIKQYKTKRERLISVISAAIKKVKKRLTAITAKERDAESAEENRIKGELLLANIYRFKGGEKECELDNYYDGSKVKITLDERLSPAKNAENYYKKYNKQKRTLTALKPQREQAETELKYFTSILDEIELAETILDLTMVQKELESVGLLVEKRVTTKKRKEDESFCRVYSVSGFIVRAGRNNAENDKLTFTAKQDDIWVHAKDYHSSHVLVESNGKEVPESVITIAAEISAYYSKGRCGGKTEVVYTKRKNVKKPPRSKPGFCIYENFKSVMVEPQKHQELLKDV
ncbi:MAG: fibronectin/fibrinogen-binding protein [Clostridiales bacterium]|nr:fibronectin/fibrinogen-binding protein [Clostridiales bacterium]